MAAKYLDKRIKVTSKTREAVQRQGAANDKRLQSHSYPENYRGMKNVDSWDVRASASHGKPKIGNGS